MIGLVAVLGFVLLGFLAVDGAVAQTGTGAFKPIAATQDAATVLPSLHSAAAGDVIHITLGRSAVLTSSSPLRRIYVGNPAVLQTYTSGSSEIVLTAKTPGVSSMVLWDEAGGRRLYTVSADLDPRPCARRSMRPFPVRPSMWRRAKARYS